MDLLLTNAGYIAGGVGFGLALIAAANRLPRVSSDTTPGAGSERGESMLLGARVFLFWRGFPTLRRRKRRRSQYR